MLAELEGSPFTVLERKATPPPAPPAAPTPRPPPPPPTPPTTLLAVLTVTLSESAPTSIVVLRIVSMPLEMFTAVYVAVRKP